MTADPREQDGMGVQEAVELLVLSRGGASFLAPEETNAIIALLRSLDAELADWKNRWGLVTGQLNIPWESSGGKVCDAIRSLAARAAGMDMIEELVLGTGIEIGIAESAEDEGQFAVLIEDGHYVFGETLLAALSAAVAAKRGK